MTACISRTFMWHDRWDADHCPCVEREPNWAPQPELDASVKRVTSVSLVTRGRPCRTAGDDHHATSDRTHCGTWIRSDQFPVLWHHAVAAHHWTGRRRSRPRRTSEAMNTSMPRSLCKSLAVSCSDWSSSADELTGPFDASSVGAPLKRRVLNCIPMNWKSWLGVRSNFSKLMIQPRNWSTLMVVWACSWTCSGVSAQISQSSK